MDEQKNMSLIKKIFNAFDKGDIQLFLDSATDDVEWESGGPQQAPFAGKRHGLEEISRLFQSCGEIFECEDLEPREFIAQGNKVVVLGRHRVKVKTTGRSYESDWAMYLTLRRGKIARVVTYDDTAAAMRALKAA